MEFDYKKIQEKFLEEPETNNLESYIIPDTFLNKDPWLSSFPMEFYESWRDSGLRVQGKFPKSVGEELQSLFEQQGYTLGIHRTNMPNASVFEEGLQNKNASYDSTISTYPYFPLLLNQIYYCESWKNSIGVFLVLLPKEQEVPIYRYDQNAHSVYGSPYTLLPEYVYGFLPVRNGQVGDIIMNPNFKFFHEEKFDDEYVYDEDIPRKGGRAR